MTPANIKRARSTMRSLVNECIDRATGEMDFTKLAEDTASALNLYESDGHTISEELFEMALEFETNT